MVAVGTHLGPYKIVTRLGVGGMGEVYKAQDPRLGRDVALKVLAEKVVKENDYLGRFEREARALAAISHPNIISIYDIGFANGYYYTVMELLEGDTLNAHLRRGRLKWHEIIDIATGIADGLGSVHSKGIVHRDLKPANIFITSDGWAKLLDFGLANLDASFRDKGLKTPLPVDVARTDPGIVMGTVPYMSPEQVYGNEIDARSDIFSFGCVLYEMATGKSPFARPNKNETWAAIAKEDPKLPSLIDPSIPPRLEQIIMRCLAKKPADRYASTKELAAALRLINMRTAEKVKLRLFRTYNLARANRLYAASGALVLILIITFLTVRTLSNIGETSADAAKITNSVDYRKSVDNPIVDQSEARELYLRGRYYWNKRSPEGLKKGMEYFQQAIDKDPNYAPAYVGLADCYVLQSRYSGLQTKETFPKAKAEVIKALDLNQALGEAHATLGYIRYRYDHDWRSAESSFKRAITLSPDYATGHHWYGLSLIAQGRIDEGIAQLEEARAAEPISPIINANLGRAHYYARRYDEAIKQLNKTIELDENFIVARYMLGWIYEQKGDYQRAMTEYRKAITISENNPEALAGLARCYALTNRRQDAEEILVKLERRNAAQYLPPNYLAEVWVALDDLDRAMDYLGRAYEERTDEIVWLKVDPKFDNLRTDKRFTDLLQKIFQTGTRAANVNN